MKVFKTTLSYEIEFLTHEKLSKDEIERIRHNIEINLNTYNKVTTGGKIVVGSKEMEV